LAVAVAVAEDLLVLMPEVVEVVGAGQFLLKLNYLFR
jgi:hypothetical protein